MSDLQDLDPQEVRLRRRPPAQDAAAGSMFDRA
jgi:hypothetical protein